MLKKIKWKKVLKWTGISFLLILIFLALIPILFKGKILDEVKRIANEELNATVDFDDVEITFLSTFPNLTVSITDVSLEGKGDFERITLYSAIDTRLTLDLWTVMFGDEMKINSIILDQPKIHLLTLEDGRANYLDIIIPDSTKEEPDEPTKFKLALDEFKIIDGEIIMDDKMYGTKISMHHIDHLTSGEFTEEEYDMETATKIASLSYEEGAGYLLKEVEFGYDAKLHVLSKEDEFTVTFNDNKLSINELVTSFEGFYSMFNGYDNMDIKLDGETISVKSLLSILPGAYTQDFASVKATGDLIFDLHLKGRMDDKILPGITFNLGLTKGSVKYPSLPGTITNIGLDFHLKKPEEKDLNSMVVSGKGIHMNLGKNSIDAFFAASNLMIDPNINAGLLAKLKLEELKNFMPMDENESYAGNLDANIKMKGKVSDLENENYDAFQASGYMKMDQINIVTSAVPRPIQIPSGELLFRPQDLQLTHLDLLIGESDIKLDGTIENYLPYMFHEGILKGGLNVNSNLMNYSDLVAESTDTTEVESVEATEAPKVPKNLDLFLKSKITKFNYPDLPIENFVGNVKVKDGVLVLEELGIDVLKGRAIVDGSYVNEENPKLTMNLDLKNLDIEETAIALNNSDKMLPYLKDLKGTYSGKIQNFKADLDKNLNMVLPSVFAKGVLQTKNIDATNMKAVKQLKEAGKNIKFLQNSMAVKNINVSFKIEEGVVHIEEFPIKLKDRSILVSGSNHLDGKIDYSIKIPVKKSDFPPSTITAVEEQAKKLGLGDKISLPNEIMLKGKITGTYNKPKVALDNMKDAIAGQTKGLKDKIVEEVKEVIEEKIEEVKEDIQAKKDSIMAAAKVKAAKIKADAQKKADKYVADAMKKINDQIANEKNPIKKKILQKAAGEGEKQARKQAQKIIEDGDKKANKVMDDANKEADALGDKV
jgi:hypothetical protein